jgi:hypothetical protein
MMFFLPFDVLIYLSEAVKDLYLLADISLIFLIDNLTLGVNVFTNDLERDKNKIIH